MNKRKVHHYSIQERLAKTLTSIGDCVIATDVEGNVDFINSGAEKLTGWYFEDAIGKPFDEVFVIENNHDIMSMQSKFPKVIDEKRVIGLIRDSVLITKSGTKYYLSASFSPIVADDEVIGVVVVFRDISRVRSIEDALVIERNNLQSMFEDMPVGMISVDQHVVVRQVNNMFLKMFNVKKEQVLNQVFGEGIVCINSLEEGCGKSIACQICKLRQEINKYIETGMYSKNVLIQISLFKNDIVEKWWCNINFVPINRNNRQHIIVVVEDVTQRIIHEEKLEKAKQSSIKMLDTLPIMVWRTNESQQTDYLNLTFLSFLGMAFDDAMIRIWDTIHPDDLNKSKLTFTNAFELCETYEMEFRMRRADGVYRSMVGVGAPYYDLEDKFAGFVGVLYDITRRKEAEQTALDNQMKYHSLFMNMESGFTYLEVIKDAEGHCVDARFQETNSAFDKMFSIFHEKLVGTRLSDFKGMQEDQLNEIFWQFDKVLNLNESFHLEEYFLEFTDKWYSLSLYSPEENSIAMLIQDIDYKKKTEIEIKNARDLAEAANKAKSQFLANMSHEIRTPVNGIVGMIDLTLMNIKDEDQKENLTSAKSCANTLIGIINDILDYSKLEAQKIILNQTPINCHALINEVMSMNQSHADTKGLTLKVEIDDEIPKELMGDGLRMKQILNNLVSNAIKFTEIGGVLIRVHKIHDTNESIELKFSVTDTGIGIASENLGKLFKGFSQIDGSYTRQFGGTGLGLVISKQLVELMHGTLWLESAKDVGSTFSFTVQLKRMDQENQDEVLIKSRLQPNGLESHRKHDRLIKKQILVAEDDRINQMVITRMLKKYGYDVEVVNNGLAAVVAHATNTYDCILMDIQMPEMDGVEATMWIRKKEGNSRHTPIIAVTAFALEGDRDKFISNGMDEYLSKPINMDKLLDLLEKVIPNNDINKTVELVEETRGIDITAVEKSLANVLKYAVEKRELELERVAHTLKEQCDQLNITQLKEIAFKLELASRRGDMNQVMKFQSQLETEMRRIII